MFGTYLQLGVVAQERDLLEDAEDLYRKSLVIREYLRNRPGIAFAYGQIGLLAEKREHWKEALAWMVRCVALFSEFPHPATGPGPENLSQLAGLLGTSALEDCWRQVTGQALPDEVRAYVDAYVRT
ncbi:MAG TPA: tetratricopeptide repeat protein [Streptosporangiaceae bacterium]